MAGLMERLMERIREQQMANSPGVLFPGGAPSYGVNPYPRDPRTPQLGVGFTPYSVIGGESGRMGAPITMRGGTDDPAGEARARGQPLSVPEMMPSPGMQPGPMAFPQALDTFGGYDDGLRPIPHTADAPPVPSRGEQRAMQAPADPALMDAEMMKMGKGPFAPGRINKQAQDEAFTDERAAEEGPPPSMDELAQMAQNVGIDPEAFRNVELGVSEARNAGYLLRMMEAENTIRELGDSNTWWQRTLSKLPGQELESLFMDPDYRRYMLAMSNFNEPALRSATGATINESELPVQRRNYFPLPNDPPETREFLRRQREALMMSLAAGSGALRDVLPAFGEPVVPRDAGPVDYSTMSDEDLLRALQGGN